MEALLCYSLRADGTGAELRVEGVLTVSVALHIVHACRRLPPAVWWLHADLERLEVDGTTTLAAFVALLGGWRRGALMTVSPPAAAGVAGADSYPSRRALGG